MISNGPCIVINNKLINNNTLPYIIAEIGVNHEGSIEKAKGLVKLARDGCADAVKFQAYKAESLACKKSPAYWDLSKEPSTSQFELFKKHDRFGEREYEVLAEYCQQVGIDFLCTPFDEGAVDFLFPLVPCFKVASADITNFPLLRKIASKGKPVLLSTGASTLSEIEMAISELEGGGCESLALLHCVLSYPTPYENAHLNMVEGLRRAFPSYVIGYSDHSEPDSGMLVLTAAYLKGARIIEKHFTYDKTQPGNDHYHAMDVNDLILVKENLSLLKQVEGESHKAPLSSESSARKNARRSIVAKRSIKKGEVLTDDMLTCKRPASGISPIHWDNVIGRKAATDMNEDAIIEWQMLQAGH